VLKASYLIAPAVALVLVVSWNVMERRSARSLSQESDVLKQLIADTGRTSAARPREVRKTRPAAGGGIDWKSVSRGLQNDAGGLLPSIRQAADLGRQIDEMSADELLAALDEVRALDLGDEERGELEAMLFDPLVAKDPALALKRFADRIGNDDDAVGWQLSSAMAAWAKRDPKAAAAWFDQQIAAGVFEAKSLDGRSQARLEFEGALVAELLEGNPDAASARLAKLPEDQRREALEQISFSELDPEARAAYAALVRGLVPQDERAGSFTHVISDLMQDSGFDEVDRFLDQINATSEERSVSAREAANARFEEIASERAITREDVDAMRQWIGKQAPGSADRVTGEALGDASQDGGEFDFDAASKLALEYHRKSSGDDVLVAFLESFAARSNSEQAIHLAEQIRNPKRREEILEQLR
jgi:hypothetical protein